MRTAESRRGLSGVNVLAWLVIIAAVLCALFYFAKRSSDQAKQDDEIQTGRLMTEGMSARLREDGAAQELILAFAAVLPKTRVAASPLHRCDITAVFIFDTGERVTKTAYWESWDPGEEKSINVSTAGNIQRVDITGVAYFTSSDGPTFRGTLDDSFGFGSK